MGATKANSAIVHAGFDADTLKKEAELNIPSFRFSRRLENMIGFFLVC